jgi:hypothetical protein
MQSIVLWTVTPMNKIWGGVREAIYRQLSIGLQGSVLGQRERFFSHVYGIATLLLLCQYFIEVEDHD